MGTHISNRDIYFQSFTLNDPAVIELLITHRYKYDDNMFLDYGDISGATGAYSVNTEVVTTYVELDSLIAACKFTDYEMTLIRTFSLSYTLYEVSKIMQMKIENMDKKMKTIYKRIAESNLRKWRTSIYADKLKLKNITCSKCKNDLPATEEFFAGDYSKKTGFRGICKNCR